MKKRRSDGIGTVALVIIVVIVALLGVVGWLVWDKMHNPAPAATQSTTKAISGTAAEHLVSEFYGKYAVVGSDRASLIRQYGTTSLLTDYNAANNSEGTGEDPIICAQAIAPIDITGYTVRTSSVDVKATETFDTPQSLIITVVDQNGLKIDHVTCPQH